MPFSNNRNSRDDKSGKWGKSRPQERDGERKFEKRTSRTSGGESASWKGPKKKWDSKTDSGTGDKRESTYSRKGNSFGKSDSERNTGADRFERKSSDNKFGKKSSDNKFERRSSGDKFERRSSDGKSAFEKRDGFARKRKVQHPAPIQAERNSEGLIRLNRYIANSGICSRRKADELIQAGVVTVNGEVVTELGIKVDLSRDEIRYNGERLKREKMTYVLLNKPKDFITTTDDPQERRTVMQLVQTASKERIYPVGRLDRNTTGLLLLTNDGDLAEKLSHPRNSIRKIYSVELNKNLAQGDLNKIAYGLELEDGFIKPDEISYIQGGSKREVGIQIHSGKNRIVRRIFESLGYEVAKLDRVVYANLTKKDLPRGRWRYLSEAELVQIKHIIK